MFKKRGLVTSQVNEVHFLPDRCVYTPQRLNTINWNAHIQYPQAKRSLSGTPAPGYVIQRLQVMKKQPPRFRRDLNDQKSLGSDIKTGLEQASQLSQGPQGRCQLKTSCQFPIFEDSAMLFGQYQMEATTKKIQQMLNNPSMQQIMKMPDSLQVRIPQRRSQFQNRKANKKRADEVVETQNEFYAEQSELRQTLNQINVFKLITQMETINYKYYELFNQNIQTREQMYINQMKNPTISSSSFRKYVEKSHSILDSKIALSLENSIAQSDISEQKRGAEISFLLTEIKDYTETPNFFGSDAKTNNTMLSVDTSEQQSQGRENKIELSNLYDKNEIIEYNTKVTDVLDGMRTISNVDSEIFDFLDGIAANRNIRLELEVYNNLYISYKRDFIALLDFYITETTQYTDFSKIAMIEMKVPKNINMISIFKGIELEFKKKINIQMLMKYIAETKTDTQFKFYANYNICLNFTKSSLLSQYRYIVGKPFYLVVLEAFIYNFFYVLQMISNENPDYLVLKLKTTEIDYLKQLLRKKQKEYYGEYDAFLTIFKKYLQFHEENGYDENYIYFLSLLDRRIEFQFVEALNTILGERQLIARYYKAYSIQIEILELIINILNHYERFIQSEFNIQDNALVYLRPENIAVIQQIQKQIIEIKENGNKPIQHASFNDFLY